MGGQLNAGERHHELGRQGRMACLFPYAGADAHAYHLAQRWHPHRHWLR